MSSLPARQMPPVPFLLPSVLRLSHLQQSVAPPQLALAFSSEGTVLKGLTSVSMLVSYHWPVSEQAMASTCWPTLIRSLSYQ